MLRGRKSGTMIQTANGGGHGIRSNACTGYSRDNQRSLRPDGSLGGGCTQLPGAGDGYHGGKLLATLQRKLSPSKRGWAWYECAGRCSGAPGCEHWYVTKAKVCVLRQVKARAIVLNTSAIAHGMRSSCDGFCPSRDCDQ